MSLTLSKNTAICCFHLLHFLRTKWFLSLNPFQRLPSGRSKIACWRLLILKCLTQIRPVRRLAFMSFPRGDISVPYPTCPQESTLHLLCRLLCPLSVLFPICPNLALPPYRIVVTSLLSQHLLPVLISLFPLLAQLQSLPFQCPGRDVPSARFKGMASG